MPRAPASARFASYGAVQVAPKRNARRRKRGIQYSVQPVVVTGSPACAGDDGGGSGETAASPSPERLIHAVVEEFLRPAHDPLGRDDAKAAVLEERARRDARLGEEAQQAARPRAPLDGAQEPARDPLADRKSTRLNSSHVEISYAV